MSKVIAISFDGTIYDFAGDPLEGAIDVINKYYNQGHTIIIWSRREGDEAEEAILALERDGAKYHHFKFNSDARKFQYDILIDSKAIHSLVIGINWEELDMVLDAYLNDDL